MKRVKYLLPLIVCTFVYVLVSITVGQSSINCYQNLNYQKKIISKQTSNLQNINNELILELTALKNDKDVIAAYARKLDYVKEGEKLVKINGLKPAQTSLYDTGSVIKHEETKFLSEKMCKIISVFFGILSFILVFMFDTNKDFLLKKKDKKSFVAGVPVYDLPQI